MNATVATMAAAAAGSAVALAVGLSLHSLRPTPPSVTVAAAMPATEQGEADLPEPVNGEDGRDLLAESLAASFPTFELQPPHKTRGGLPSVILRSPDGSQGVTATLSHVPSMTLDELREVATQQGEKPSRLVGDTLLVDNRNGTSAIRMLPGGHHVVVGTSADVPGAVAPDFPALFDVADEIERRVSQQVGQAEA